MVARVKKVADFASTRAQNTKKSAKNVFFRIIFNRGGKILDKSGGYGYNKQDVFLLPFQKSEFVNGDGNG